MIKYTQQQVEAAIAAAQGQGREVARILGTSESHAYYLIRARKARQEREAAAAAQQAAPVAAVAPAAVIPAPAAIVTPVAQDQTIPAIETVHTNAPVQIVRTEVDRAAFMPAVMSDYKRRGLDEQIEYCLKNGLTPLLVGEAGSGKTTAGEQIAARARLPFLRVPIDNQSIFRDLLGRAGVTAATSYYRFGLLLEFLQFPCVILIDEVNGGTGGANLFLHELLDKVSSGSRRVFIKECDAVVNVHPEAHIILSCNPNTAKYSGTNRLNAALVDRCAVLEFPAITPDDVPAFFDCGKAELTQSLKNFYTEARRCISENSLRVVFSLRGVKRISAALRAGIELNPALYNNFLNHAYMTASDTEREQLAHLAQTCFGAQVDVIGGRR